MKMWRVIISVILALVFYAMAKGCVHASVPSGPIDRWEPMVITAPGSDQVPDDLVAHVLKRTNGFCRDKGRYGVRYLTLFYDRRKLHLEVVYKCWDF